MVIVLFDLEGTLVQSVEPDPKAVLEARAFTILDNILLQLRGLRSE